MSLVSELKRRNIFRVAASTVNREIARNRGRRSYRATDVDDLAWNRARRPKPCKLAQQQRLQSIVAKKLSLE